MPTGSGGPSPSVTDGRMFSVEEAARVLNVSRPYVVALAESGALGIVARTKAGKRRISATAVDAYCAQQRSMSRNALAELAAISQEVGCHNSDTRGR